MRTFSALRATCSFPEKIDRPSARRDAAAELGTQFHAAAEEWIVSLTGEHRGLPEPAATWMDRLKNTWAPPAGIECEVPLGLEDVPLPQYVAVTEPEPHVYVPKDPEVKLLTAGRADWIWPDPEDTGVVNVCDIKTGAFYLGPPRQVRQILAQGFAACRRANAHAFRVGIYYARAACFDWAPAIHKATPEWRAAWEDVVTAAKLPAEPIPGGWCISCFSRKDCPQSPVVP